ncbi:hypothetical protein GMA11_06160 [Granulicatella sp. zg-ZJ]|uniref:hypothetical protein n=1 Tax=Granulicatella sp. zg-ZJ TaxID=2678504 RepID=UPI0013D18C7E|nr:hypothetical protein [Granulicatella sp. zg-ZJ]MBS4749595.1 hypothetical protein [Carnobacteriaceae bacterium zg-ZUI78]NEW62429.1 hypothetical protein [Granulicatella sp. zg-ZJ]NEW62975.1 hypothetical protein [Granulicatella sp. zg-ZJ]
MRQEEREKIEDITRLLNDLMAHNYTYFIKALLMVEKEIDDMEIIDKMYQMYISNDQMTLLHESFDDILMEIENEKEERRNDLLEEK